MRKLLPLLLACTALPGCGLQPLYGNGSHSAAAQTLATVHVSSIEGRAGWLVRNAIVDRIGDNGGNVRYRLDIKLDDDIVGLGIRSDQSTTRERRQLRARFQLVDTTTDKNVIDATTASDVGIDVVNSEYATIAAEQTALERLADTIADQIVARIAVQAQKHGDASP